MLRYLLCANTQLIAAERLLLLQAAALSSAATLSAAEPCVTISKGQVKRFCKKKRSMVQTIRHISAGLLARGMRSAGVHCHSAATEHI